MTDLLVELIEETTGYTSMIENLNNGAGQQYIYDLGEEALPLLSLRIREKLGGPLVVVTDNQQRAEKMQESLLACGFSESYTLPQLEIMPHETLDSDLTLRGQRMRVLTGLLNSEEMIVFIPIQSLLRQFILPKTFSSLFIDFQVGERFNLEEVSKRLTTIGYSREAMVETPGEFSIRGGILDIYPLTVSDPVRIEFFDEEIESVRYFDQGTQRSRQRLEGVKISPVSEYAFLQQGLEEGLKRIEEEAEESYQSLIRQGLAEEAEQLEEKIASDLDLLRQGLPFAGSAKYLPYFYHLCPLWDYLPGKSFLLYKPERILKRAETLLQEFNELQVSLLEQGSILPSYHDLFLDYMDLQSFFQQQVQLLISDQEGLDWDSIDYSYPLSSTEVENFRGQLELLRESLSQRLEQRYRILLTVDGQRKAERLESYLREHGLPASVSSLQGGITAPGAVVILPQSLEKGFVLPEAKAAVYTEDEIFGNKPKRKKRRGRELEEGVKLKSFEELEVGDFVVHENHGIGKYLGIKTLDVQDFQQDYLVIKYRGADKLYVPTDQIDIIQKYVGLDEQLPRLNKLGGQEWSRVKKKVQKSVREMAEDLLELYARREVSQGYAFSPDTVWQQEFEEDFPYQETPDQLQAIEEIKEDMEDERPMDRLLCGDVGYGKTEVAIRASFKAIMDEKQVAVLVPTTILAQQHYNTFQERFANFPVTLEMLSRFRSPREQKEILSRLRNGKLDIVIGTHRLLSRDIDFKDLGLLVVDEEQRFGVSHKERLKEIKGSVDVLTLTATPIPRTLHMSLVGVRDMSIIETPPENRYPIRTYVREYNDDLIREAIRRELNRGGQIYYVHNRVENIEQIASEIKKMVPEASIAIGHGQMSESELEQVMLDFLAGEYDILVCTTIIENGLDISNVNTIIINNAQRMGLAQLYQLRGRVGRTNRVAYAYLFYQAQRILNEDAEKRLRAIKEFSSLGSGFKLAMRDLEIRGAGNLLGAEQHGHIASIGFSLYCKLLEDTIKELRGEREEKVEEAEVEVEVDAYLPEDFIPDSRQKIEIYKKIARISDEEDALAIKEELEDRFGFPPEPTRNLIQLATIRSYATQIGVSDIRERDQAVSINLKEDIGLTGENLIELSREYPRQIKFKASRNPVIRLKIKDLKGNQKLLRIYDLLKSVGQKKKKSPAC